MEKLTDVLNSKSIGFKNIYRNFLKEKKKVINCFDNFLYFS